MDPPRTSRCVGRAMSREQARQIADQFEAQGFRTNIIEITRGTIHLYEVWAEPKDEGRTIG